MEAREFLGIEPLESDKTKWRLHVEPRLTTPGKFLFGGCGLGAALEALEGASNRKTIWATAQYLSYAPLGATVDYELDLIVEGSKITQGRATARCDGREIITVNAALGVPQIEINEIWVTRPDVPPPETCPRRTIPDFFVDTILDHVDARVAKGRGFNVTDGPPGSPETALWARVPGHLSPSSAMLAIFGDYVSGGVSEPLGHRTLGRSLDNTMRFVQLEPTEWVLCDIRMHAVVNGYAQGIAFLWSEHGTLLATASQSFSMRFWDEDDPKIPGPDRR